MTKTYREVIKDIKKGERWIGEYFAIYMKMNGTLCIYFHKTSKNCGGIVIEESDMFTLQRQEYDFIEAWKAYKEGKEIKSLESGDKLKLIDGKDMFFWTYENEWEEIKSIQYDEINGKWYIND